jgi:CRP-like cAMP-binding protein
VFERLHDDFPADYEQLNGYRKFFKQIEVPAKTILLREGEVARKFYWIQNGCVRVWFNNNGEGITFQFFFENSAVASIESFRKSIPSSVTLETIEPSVLWSVDKSDVEQIFAEIMESPRLRELFINSIFERTFDYMKHFLSFIRDTPTQRYLNLVRDRPELVKRIPQHYIASYLGITRVHLSRIRNKISRGSIL